MKKQTVVMICIIVLLLLVVGCFGIYGYINYQNSKKHQNIELFSCMPSDIVKYSVKNGNESYTLVKTDGVWTVEGNEVAVLAQKSVQDIVNSASLINSQGVLKKKALKEFEMTDAQTVTLNLVDESEIKISFVGHKGETCAVRINNDEEIYAVRKSMRDILVAKLDKLRAALVFEELMKTDDILTYYSFTGYDKTKTVVRTKTATEISNSKSNRYIMESPYRKDVDDDRFEQQIVVRIPAIAVVSYVDDFPENMSEYGLDEESRAVLNFKWGDRNETLYLGKEDAGKVYAVKAGKDGIFVLNASQLEFLNTEPFYILESGILSSDIENIRSVTVKTATDVYEVTSSQRNVANGLFYVNGKAASRAAFDSVAELIGGLEILSEISGKPENKGEIVVMVYYDNGTASQTISMTGVNEKSYAAFINGKAEFAVSRKTVDALLDELNNISKNPMKTNKEG